MSERSRESPRFLGLIKVNRTAYHVGLAVNKLITEGPAGVRDGLAQVGEKYEREHKTDLDAVFSRGGGSYYRTVADPVKSAWEALKDEAFARLHLPSKRDFEALMGSVDALEADIEGLVRSRGAKRKKLPRAA